MRYQYYYGFKYFGLGIKRGLEVQVFGLYARGVFSAEGAFGRGGRSTERKVIYRKER